jgi:hypothetical protein
MASTGRDILGEHYDDEHLTYEEVRELGLKVVTEKGETVPTDELQGKVFRIVDKDDGHGRGSLLSAGVLAGRLLVPGPGLPLRRLLYRPGSRGNHVVKRMAGS